jgi:hypothetical protein
MRHRSILSTAGSGSANTTAFNGAICPSVRFGLLPGTGPGAQPGNAFRAVAVNPIAQGLAVHPGQPRCAGPIHAFQRVGDRDQPGADATVALAPRAGAASATERTRKEP